MLTFLRTLRKPTITPLNTIHIDREALLSNLKTLQSIKSWDHIFPVLKSNAYGHGIKEVSTILRETSVPYICVDSFPEYQIVKTYAKKSSLVIGETLPENYRHYDHRRATPCVYNIATLQALIATWKPRKIHLFLNTGMNREGIQDRELSVFLKLLNSPSWSRIQLEGVISHLANADEIDTSFNTQQYEAYIRMLTYIEDQWFSPIYTHIWNSAGISKINADRCNAWRSGLAFYGYNPLTSQDVLYDTYSWLQPALSIRSTVTAIQHITPWELVSYSGSFVAKHYTTIATIPFWYQEWLMRRLSNQWLVKHIRTWKLLPLVGNICMNLCCLDTLDIDVQLWDQIEIISATSHSGENTIDEFARRVGTISYEVLTGIDQSIRREVI